MNLKLIEFNEALEETIVATPTSTILYTTSNDNDRGVHTKEGQEKDIVSNGEPYVFYEKSWGSCGPVTTKGATKESLDETITSKGVLGTPRVEDQEELTKKRGTSG